VQKRRASQKIFFFCPCSFVVLVSFVLAIVVVSFVLAVTVVSFILAVVVASFVLAVILSAAKDPERVNLPQPFESFCLRSLSPTIPQKHPQRDSPPLFSASWVKSMPIFGVSGQVLRKTQTILQSGEAVFASYPCNPRSKFFSIMRKTLFPTCQAPNRRKPAPIQHNRVAY
jgi:hypothetical protein